MSLKCLALASGRSILEPADIGCTGHGGSFRQIVREVKPIALLPPESCHTNSMQTDAHHSPLWSRSPESASLKTTVHRVVR